MSEKPDLEAMRDLIREGAANYLDALWAIHRFRRHVADVSTTVLIRHLPDLARALGAATVNSNDLTVYLNLKPDGMGDKEYDGNWALITACVWFRDPLNFSAQVGLSFHRNEPDGLTIPSVTFMCKATLAPIFNRLKLVFRDERDFDASDADKECGLFRTLDSPLTVEEEIERITSDAVEIWKKIGGWSLLSA